MASLVPDCEHPAILAADYPSEPLKRRYLTPNPASFRDYQCCPWATTVVMRCPETQTPLACAINCKRWGCKYCAPRKIRKLAFLTNGASPNRWIRLGVRPSIYDTPQHAWEVTSPLVPELFRKFRQARPDLEYEYLRVCELHTGDRKYGDYGAEAKGFPHYHLLLRTPYIAQKQLSETWAALTAPKFPPLAELDLHVHDLQTRGLACKRLIAAMSKTGQPMEVLKSAWIKDTGATNVWISKIDQSFSSFRYLTKYLTKLHRIEWTDRHVSYSAKFFRGEDKEKISYPVRDVITRSELHPWKYLADNFPDDEVGLDEKGQWRLPYLPTVPQVNVPMHELGLRIPPPMETMPAAKQMFLLPDPYALEPGYEDNSF